MTVFNDIKLTWGGRTYNVPSNRVMGAILRIEDIVTLNELKGYTVRGAAPLGKIAAAYAAVLQYAGAQASDEQVYQSMFQGDGQEVATEAVTALLLMMLPKDVTVRSAEKGNASAAGSSSSRKRSKKQSAAANG